MFIFLPLALGSTTWKMAPDGPAKVGRCGLATLSCAGNWAPVLNLSATDWTLVTIPFSSLTNGTAAFDRTDIWSVEFRPGYGAFDFWIDDLSFY